MSKVLQAYRDLYRRIGRLPLDTKSLSTLKKNVRKEFCNGKKVHRHAGLDSKRFQSFIGLLDDILIYRKYKRLADILDIIYKPKELLPDWAKEFCSSKYSTWKGLWPQVHLIHEFGSEKSKRLYDEQLQELAPNDSFLLVKELGLVVPEKELLLIPLPLSSPGLDTRVHVLKMVLKFHNFIDQNADKLLDLKVLPLEVYYEPNRMGLPLSVAARENKLKQKINYVKSLIRQFRPFVEKDLKHLSRFASLELSDCEIAFNKNFEKFMRRQNRHDSKKVSPFVKNYVWQKKLIPDERNIRFHYKKYLMKQFYVDEAGTYQTNPAKNFYD